MAVVLFVNSVNSDEVAHVEPPHLNLNCLFSSLRINNMIYHIYSFINQVFSFLERVTESPCTITK